MKNGVGMMIRREYPPWIDRIDAKFKSKGKKVLYAWGDWLYQPIAFPIPDDLMKHELVHMSRQRKMGVEAWWDRYIEDDAFRLYEEVLAHKAEYYAIIHDLTTNRTAGRSTRRRALVYVARRLIAPLYAYKPPISLHTAKNLLTSPIESPPPSGLPATDSVVPGPGGFPLPLPSRTDFSEQS